ncbi:MAG: YceH family protein [Bryobacteraceae bacterium]|nr:YceH family protein [Bryobacteraceae bacterium]
MMLILDRVEVRILGCLIEKDITTPEYYPMTLNALVNACNQKSNREPVVAWDEDLVAEGIDTLRAKKLLGSLTGAGNRVPKYSHLIQQVLNLGRREVAVLCELMLRGPQTSGELRDRASRMHRFSDMDEVEACLARLNEHPAGSMVKQLPRQAGRKEPRYAHLLSGEPVIPSQPDSADGAMELTSPLADRVEALEADVRELRALLLRVTSELGIS